MDGAVDEPQGERGAGNIQLMPWLLGAPWVPRFGERTSPEQFSDWRAQIEVFLRAQNLNVAQQVDFVLSALQGDARREILLLPVNGRDTPNKIFQALESLYGDQASKVQLRAKFFTCKQLPGEGVGAFILRLRECLARWQVKEPGSEDAAEEMLQSQLVAGLTPGPVQLELQKLVRRSPTLKFADLSVEARVVERELQRVQEADTQRVCIPAPASAPMLTPSVAEWRESLKAEVLVEIRQQLSSLKNDILGEMREHFSDLLPRPSAASAAADRPRWKEGPLGRHRERALRWDDQGRPICLRCRRPGHMKRDCPSGSAPSQDF